MLTLCSLLLSTISFTNPPRCYWPTVGLIPFTIYFAHYVNGFFVFWCRRRLVWVASKFIWGCIIRYIYLPLQEWGYMVTWSNTHPTYWVGGILHATLMVLLLYSFNKEFILDKHVIGEHHLLFIYSCHKPYIYDIPMNIYNIRFHLQP